MLPLLICKALCYLLLALLHLWRRLATWHRRELLIGALYLALFCGIALEPLLHGVPGPASGCGSGPLEIRARMVYFT